MSGLQPNCVRFVRFVASGLSGLPIGNRTYGRKPDGLLGALLRQPYRKPRIGSWRKSKNSVHALRRTKIRKKRVRIESLSHNCF